MSNLVEEDEDDDDDEEPDVRTEDLVSEPHTPEKTKSIGTAVSPLDASRTRILHGCFVGFVAVYDCDLQLTQPARLGSKPGRRAVLRHVAPVAAMVATRGMVAEKNDASRKS